MEGKDGEMIWEMILSRKFSSFIFSFKNVRFCAVKLLQKYMSISTKSKQELVKVTDKAPIQIDLSFHRFKFFAPLQEKGARELF